MKNYICAYCREKYKTTRPDEVGEKECLELFGIDPLAHPEMVDIICDDCFTRTAFEFPEWFK